MLINFFLASLFINASVVDMHAEKDGASEVVSQAIYGTPVKLVQEDNGWVLIETPDAYQGWIIKPCLIDKELPRGTMEGRVKIAWTHFYQTPDVTPKPPLLWAPYGAKIKVLSEIDDRWLKAQLLDGTIVYSQSADFDLTHKPLTLDEMLSEGKQFLGLPYRWGGNSGFGFDCSGLVQTLFNQMDVHLPRDSKDQAKAVQPVEAKRLLKGDLLFFGKGKDKVTHVGIYLGNNEFMHSVTGNKKGPHVVQVSKLNDPEWQEKFIFGGRVSY